MSEILKNCQFCVEEVLTVATRYKHRKSMLVVEEQTVDEANSDLSIWHILIAVVAAFIIFWVGVVNTSSGSTTQGVMCGEFAKLSAINMGANKDDSVYAIVVNNMAHACMEGDIASKSLILE